MEKLVRDRIPTIMRESGVVADVRHVHNAELLPWLLRKLHEETDELNESPSLDECADVFEVLCAIGRQLGYSVEDIACAADSKRKARGAFDDGCILNK
ncbi:MAG: hypothetical protein A2503_17750 [Burkholderiales bacterium RIFOXYD12_FULL_59_19]|nr:MAG: hypothetical protein A2503_17750 [Burkholderiales bacterium RIFOXYD12_FULL_59_19]